MHTYQSMRYLSIRCPSMRYLSMRCLSAKYLSSIFYYDGPVTRDSASLCITQISCQFVYPDTSRTAMSFEAKVEEGHDDTYENVLVGLGCLRRFEGDYLV